jgi:hypothetical protein
MPQPPANPMPPKSPTRGQRHGEPWAEAEDRLLLSSSLPDSELARQLGRTKNAVTHRRIFKRIRRRPTSRRWTEDELCLVGKLPDIKVAAMTGRSLAAIQTRRITVLALPCVSERGRKWTPEEDQLLGKYAEGDLAKRFDCTSATDPSPGRWFSRDPIEEDGGLSLYGFSNNDPLDENDFLGLKIKGCIDRYLNSLGLRADTDYTKSKDGVYSTDKDFQGTDDNNFSKLVVIRMLKSTTVFSLAGSGENENESNIKKHITARQTIVNNALNANFKFGTGVPHPTTGFLSDPQKYFDSLNNGETIIACHSLSYIIFETGNKFNRDGNRNYDAVWIPGDWGYIRNLDYEEHPENWGRDGLSGGAWSGENVFHPIFPK